jgi:hypothetical protein
MEYFDTEVNDTPKTTVTTTSTTNTTNTTNIPSTPTTPVTPSTTQETTNTTASTGGKVLIIAIIIFVVLWIGLGIAAFIMSLVCFGYSGTTAQHIIGVILAVLFGPFYWIYYAVSKTYCGKNFMGGKR